MNFIFCVFSVFQCMALGAALDTCLCFLLPEEYLTDQLNNYCWYTRGSRIFSGGSTPDGQKTVWTAFFSPQLILQLTEGVNWFYYRENYTFQKIQRGSNIFQGGQTFSRGGGVQMLISIITNIACDFPGGGGPDTLSPSGSAHGWYSFMTWF